MPNIIEIIKQRWPEAALIIIFLAGSIILMEQFMNVAAPPQSEPDTFNTAYSLSGSHFVFGFGITILLIIWLMLYIGFLVTAFTEGCTPQEPKELVRIGRSFFWRMFRFQIVFSCAHMLIVGIISGFITAMVMTGGPIETVPLWIMSASSFAAIVVLLKPILLMPALMIVQDRMVREAFVSLKDYRILEAPGLLKLFFGGFGVVFLFTIAQGLTTVGTFGYYILTGISALCSGFVMLLIGLGGVKFIVQRTDFALEKELTEDNLKEENEG